MRNVDIKGKSKCILIVKYAKVCKLCLFHCLFQQLKDAMQQTEHLGVCFLDDARWKIFNSAHWTNPQNM